MTAQCHGIDLNNIPVNLMAGEHLKPEFLKINPQHTLPTLVDNDFVLWESRAIMIYLVEKYARTDSLYKQCPDTRALINQRLYFDLDLTNALSQYIYGPLLAKTPFDPEKRKKLDSQLEMLNILLAGNDFVIGTTLTLADLSLCATITTVDVIGSLVNGANMDIKKYPNIKKWYDNMRAVTPGFKENYEGCLELVKLFGSN